MKKIAFVVHRYGNDITGGAEYECMLLAHHIKEKYEVEVLTTCAKNDSTWENEYPEGIEYDNGIKVHRFLVNKNRQLDRYNDVFTIVDSEHEINEEIDWLISQGPYSYDLFKFIHVNYNRYDVVIFMTYLYYTSAVCMMGIPNAVFIPTAHDERPIYLRHFRNVFEAPKAILYNTSEEKDLVERLFPETKNKPSIVGVLGFDIPEDTYGEKCSLSEVPENYILYAGRITPAKGCDELIEFFQNYKNRFENDLKLVLIGKLDMELPESQDIVFLGFVSDEDKMYLMRNAKAFVIASHFESLSMVVLEAMSVRTPVMVTKKCDVLKGHVDRSKAGELFEDKDSFGSGLNLILSQRDVYGDRGLDYVRNNYSWNKIVSNVCEVVDNVDFTKVCMDEYDIDTKTYINSKLRPSFENNNIPIVFSTDNNYAPLLAVALRSLVDNGSMDNNYDVIVLSDNVDYLNKEQLQKVVYEHANFSLRFVEVSGELNKLTFQFNNAQLSRATFMRLFIPKYLSLFEKVMYLDCDIVLRNDAAILYEYNIDGYMIGAVRDVHIGEVGKNRAEFNDYVINDVGLGKVEDYFNAGVLLLNLKEIEKKYTSKELIDIAVSRKWKWEDQDVLNNTCAGSVYYLPYNWNVFWVADNVTQHMMEMNIEYSEALLNPLLIHYAAGSLPVKRCEDRFFDEFWKYARNTSYYELLVRWMCVGRNNSNSCGVEQIPMTLREKIYWKAHAVVYYTKREGFVGMMKRAYHKIIK